MPISTNIPTESTDSSVPIRLFFDKFYSHKISFPATEIDATVTFFLQHGFEEQSARSISIVLLNQARLDGVPVFQVIDTLKGLTDIQLSQVVAQIINAYREKTSLLGYRISPLQDTYESRNILV